MPHVDLPTLIVSSVDTKHLLMVIHRQVNLHTPSRLTELYLAKFCVVPLGQLMGHLSCCIATVVSGM